MRDISLNADTVAKTKKDLRQFLQIVLHRHEVLYMFLGRVGRRAWSKVASAWLRPLWGPSIVVACGQARTSAAVGGEALPKWCSPRGPPHCFLLYVNLFLQRFLAPNRKTSSCSPATSPICHHTRLTTHSFTRPSRRLQTQRSRFPMPFEAGGCRLQHRNSGCLMDEGL